METSEVTPALQLHPAHYHDMGPGVGLFFPPRNGLDQLVSQETSLGDLPPGCHMWLQDGAGQSGQECGCGVC